MGLELAADDYLTKPFSPPRVCWRASARVLRRRQPGDPAGAAGRAFEPTVSTAGELNLNNAPPEGAGRGGWYGSANGEFSLLVVAAGGRPNRILTRDQLLDMSRLCTAMDVYNRSVNTQILRLRRKLEWRSGGHRATSVPSAGAGYVFSVRVGHHLLSGVQERAPSAAAMSRDLQRP